MKSLNFNQKKSFIFLLIIILTNSSMAQFSKKLLSETWQVTGGQGIAYKNVTVSDANRNVYVAGATISGINNSDIIIQKLDRNGLLLWEKTYAGLAGLSDAATAIVVDASFNVYVTGTIVNSTINDQDLVVLKYNSAGVLQWTYTYNGSTVNKKDAGTAIFVDPTGNRVFVAGSTGSDNTLYDYRTFSLSPSSGSLLWTKSYDFASLVDIPKKIVFSGSYVTVVGASQELMSPNKWQMATVRYNATNGALIDVVRSTTTNNTGINEINDVATDASGNTYLIGAIQNASTGSDVFIIKLDPSLNIVWQFYYDLHGLDDKGMGIEFLSGNLYLTGYSTNVNVGKETLIMKINSTGGVVWTKEISGAKGLDDKGEQLIIDANNRLYVAATVYDFDNSDYKLYCYDLNGNYLAATSFGGGSNLNDVAQSIEVDLDNNIIVTGSEQLSATAYITKTVKYSFFSQNYDYAYQGTTPTHLKGTILVKFKRQNMNLAVLNARKFYAGELSQFIDNATLNALQSKTGSSWSKYKTFKVLKNFTPNDSISITRLGDSIKAKDFWTYLAIDVPVSWNINSISDSLLTLSNFIRDASPDVICNLYNTPNDQYYLLGQKGLYPNTSYPGADIDVSGAWDSEVGQSYVKVGVLDAGINWAHEEFNNGLANLPGSSSKIGGGYNYYTNSAIQNGDQFISYNHGTAVAGIIGAKRNNFMPGNDAFAQGIAGIAGGNMGVGNFGVQLFSLGISGGPTDFVPLTVIVEALRDGYSDSPSNPNDFALQIINGSWGTDDPVNFLMDEIEECWRNHCIYIAARGQHFEQQGEINSVKYPACFFDKYLINVIASGTNGERKEGNVNGGESWSSNFGIIPANQMAGCPADITAPGVYELITSTTSNGSYAAFSGTSAAAPHVAGVAALLYSKHHINNGFPNNLGTEDIERIIEKNAIDKGSINWDLENGFGLLNAKKSLEKVSDPYYIKHLTTIPTVDVSTVLLQGVYNPDLPFSQIPYPNSKRYIYTWDIDVYLPAGHEIIDWWEMEAATNEGVRYNDAPPLYINQTNNVNNMFEETLFDPIGGSHVHKTAKTALYLVNIGSDQNVSNDIWFPVTPAELKYQFSIHVKKSPDASIDENESNLGSVYNLFPNPTSNTATIVAESDVIITSFQILDASGRLLLMESDLNKQEFTLNTSFLTNGIYFCSLKSNKGEETIRFIKTAQ